MAWPAGLCCLSLAAHVSLHKAWDPAASLHPELPFSPASVVGPASGCVCSQGESVGRLGARALLRSTGVGSILGLLVQRLEWSG